MIAVFFARAKLLGIQLWAAGALVHGGVVGVIVHALSSPEGKSALKVLLYPLPWTVMAFGRW